MPPRSRLVPLVALVVGVATACGSGDDATESAADPTTGDTTSDIEVTDTTADGDEVPALFDSSVVHDIEVSFDQADYDAMIATFTDTGDKEWIEATVTIDGVTYEQVGLRLKGNSSLAGLGGGFGGPRPATDEESGDAAGPAGGLATASADDPEELPWLIRLDEFVEGQDHQGYEDIVVRSNGSATSLNEAVALDLLEEAGLASQDAASTRFSVNGGDAILRLAIEHPDDDAWYESNFDAEGALYKAESSGDWSYRGDDPAAYEEVFDQEGGTDVTDLTPLIDFLQFLEEADDATFAAELPERLDVEAFATYLAMMDLVGNFDDIDGPGNNAYLWYDVDAEQFTVVPWDLNLAFGAFGGGAGGGPGGGFDPGDLPEGFDPSDLPEGFEPPEGVDPSQIPEGFELPEGVEPGELPAGGGGGFGGRSNVLVERFHANAEFEALYQEQLVSLRETLYDSGVATEILDSWVDTLVGGATDLVDEATITEEAAAIAALFTAG
jgi:spore coat protein CotH